jgi:hypothetical protein
MTPQFRAAFWRGRVPGNLAGHRQPEGVGDRDRHGLPGRVGIPAGGRGRLRHAAGRSGEGDAGGRGREGLTLPSRPQRNSRTPWPFAGDFILLILPGTGHAGGGGGCLVTSGRWLNYRLKPLYTPKNLEDSARKFCSISLSYVRIHPVQQPM